MEALHLPVGPASSGELDEIKWKSENSYWIGDDATSLGQFWAGNRTKASSSHAPNVEVDNDGVDDDENDDDEDDSNDDGDDGSDAATDDEHDEDFLG